MDQYLFAITQAAERGLECPPVRVLTGGVVIWGAPGPSAEFLEVTRDPLIDQYEDFARGRPRQERKEEHIDPEALAQEHMDNVRWPTGDKESNPTSLTLLDAYLWPLSGRRRTVPSGVRIPIANVQAWWIAGDNAIEAKRGGRNSPASRSRLGN